MKKMIHFHQFSILLFSSLVLVGSTQAKPGTCFDEDAYDEAVVGYDCEYGGSKKLTIGLNGSQTKVNNNGVKQRCSMVPGEARMLVLICASEKNEKGQTIVDSRTTSVLTIDQPTGLAQMSLYNSVDNGFNGAAKLNCKPKRNFQPKQRANITPIDPKPNSGTR